MMLIVQDFDDCDTIRTNELSSFEIFMSVHEILNMKRKHFPSVMFQL